MSLRAIASDWWADARASARDRELWIAGAVALGTVLLLVVTATQGFVRDEGYYFRAAADYHRWFEGLWLNLWEGRVLERKRGKARKSGSEEKRARATAVGPCRLLRSSRSR